MFRSCILLLLMACFTMGDFFFPGSETDESLGECTWNNRTVYGQFISSIKVKHSNDIRFTWSSVKDTSNIKMTYTSKVLVTNSTKEGILHLEFNHQKGNGAEGSHQNIGMLFSIVITLFYLFKEKHGLLMILLVFSCGTLVFTIPTTDCNVPSVHIQVPFKYVDTICVNQLKCFPIKCELSFLPGSQYSNIPSTNEILFSDKYCTFKKPVYWDKWVDYYFKTNTSTEQFYFADFDNDGLVNILEYYADINLFNTTSNATYSRNRRSVVNIVNIGCDPLNPDSDKDLLLDGFEYSNQMKPKKADDRNADYDNDGLTNLEEQIRKSDPLNPDTDGDGISDGQEVKNKADPLNPYDGGKEDKSVHSAMIKLTIGDHSGSHSERYLINVGEIQHQSPDYGKVGYGTYEFKPGKYRITIQHVATNLNSPDYDYTAAVAKVSGKALVSVKDSSGLLGSHYESYYDYTIGKSAELTVTANCISSDNSCGCTKSCADCNGKSTCIWDEPNCRKRTLFDKLMNNKIITPVIGIFNSLPCPCKRCLDWYQEEKKGDMSWLVDLNKKFKCPCQVKQTKFLKITYRLKEIDNPSNQTWGIDYACMANGWPRCSRYHPGANGCLRSENLSTYGSRQQCCYDKFGHLLTAGTKGAGTPDRSGQLSDHTMYDVDPFEWCCKQCEKQKECNYYIKELRKGDSSHCPGG